MVSEQQKIKDKEKLKGLKGLAPFDPAHPTTTQESPEQARIGEARILAEGGHKAISPQAVSQIKEAQEQPLAEAVNIPVGDTVEAPTGRLALGGSSLEQAQEVSRTLETVDKKKLRKLSTKSRELNLSPEEVTDDRIMQNALKLELSDLELEVLESGEASVNKIGQIVEAIPLVGKLGRKWGVQLATQPASKVDEIGTTLDTLSSSVEDNVEFAKANPRKLPQYLDTINKGEEKVLRLEAKMKLIALQSPELQGNPEGLLEIQTKIQDTKRKIDLAQLELETIRLLG